MLTGFLTILALASPQPVCHLLTVEAHLSDDMTSIAGTATCDTTQAGPWHVALYPRILQRPTGMDDVSQLWTYPEGFDPAGIIVEHAGKAVEGESAWAVVGEPTEHLTTVRLSFATRIPNRNGAFGQRAGVAYLLGGWHPVFGDGHKLDRTTIRYRITVPEKTVGFAGTTPFARRSPRVLTGEFVGRQLPLLVAPGATVRLQQDTVLLAPLDRHGNPAGHADVTAMLDDKAIDHILETLAAGATVARQAGLRVRPLMAVITPLRHRLVEPFDGGLAVSDHAFHVLPFERLMKFHRATLWREQLTQLAMGHAARNEEHLPPDLAADAVGSALRSRLMSERYAGSESAPDVLDSFDVIPEIDALIFAPQVPFVEAYFNVIDETPLARLRFDDFYHALPRGKLLYEKVHDRWGEETTQRAIQHYLHSDDDFLTALSRVGPDDAHNLLAPWIGPYPALNYRLAHVERSAGGSQVDVAVEGPDASKIIEPITVRVRGANGVQVSETRLGPGSLVFNIADPGVVELDPDGRLGEIFHAPGFNPRFDNRSPQRWRWLLQNIAGLFAVTNGNFTASADVSLRRIYDLRFGFDFFALYSPTALGVAATANYHFGHEVTALRLSDTLGLSIEFDRLLAGGGATIPGDELSMTLGYTYDTRLSPYADYDGVSYSVGVGGGMAKDTRGHDYLYTQLTAAGLKIQPLAFGHAIVGRLRYDYTIGNAPVQDLFPVGGRYLGGRGYEITELRGPQRGVISTEYRHVLSGGNRTDFWGLLMVDRVDGALFADAVYLPTKGKGCDHNWFYDVGYGLRFIGEILNISPTSLQVDFGLPLSRCPNDVETFPVTIYLAIVQSFSNY